MLSSSSLSLRDQMFREVRSLLRFFKDQLASSHINNSATSSALAGPDGDMCLILLSICRSTWLIYLFMSSSLAAINIEEFFGFHVILLCHVSNILKPKLGRWVWFKRNLQEIPIHGWILQTCVFRLYFFLSLLLHFMFYCMSKSVQRTGLVLSMAQNNIYYNISGSCVHFSWAPWE